MIFALLMTMFATLFMAAGSWLASVVFGTKCDIHICAFSMAFFCLLMYFYDEFKDW